MTFVRIDSDGGAVFVNELVKKQFEEKNES
jgi:hypothetical protein